MNKTKLLIALLFVSLGTVGQVPGFQPIRGKTQYIDSFALYKYKNNPAMDSILTTDTVGRVKLKYFPGGSGPGTVTNFSAGNLSPLFTTSVANPTSTPALSFSLSNIGQYSIFGRKAVGSGVPSFLKADSSLITDLHSESYYNTKYLGIGYTPPSVSLSQLVGSLSSNTIDNGNLKQEWQANTLAGNTFLKLTTTSTAAASNAQRVFEIDVTGTNATAGQTTYGAYIRNRHTGSGNNISLYAESVNGLFNTAITGQGNDGTGILGLANGAASKAVSGSATGGGIGVYGSAETTGYPGYFTTSGTNGIYSETLGSNTTNIAATFKADNASNYNVAINVPSGFGSVGIGTSTPDSLLTVSEGAWFKRGLRASGLPTGVAAYRLMMDASGNFYKSDSTNAAGSGTVTDFTAGNLSPLFTTSVATSTSTPALTFALSNTSQFKIYGRKASGSGVPSFLDADSSLIPGLHSEEYYNTKYRPIGYVPTLDAVTSSGNTTPNTIEVGEISIGGGLGYIDNGGGAVFSVVNLTGPASSSATIAHPWTTNYLVYTPHVTATDTLTRSVNGNIANSLGDITLNAVDSIYRTPGKDSIQFKINGRYHAIKDSTGGGVSGANQALSNLASVEINTSLLPGVDNTIDLGSSSKTWRDIYLPTYPDGVVYKGSQNFIHTFRLTGTSGDNLFFGVGAGNRTMTGSTGIQGSFNVGIGSASLSQLTTGLRNTAVGIYSQQNNSTGSNNSSLGQNSLFSNVSGYNHTAIGGRAVAFGNGHDITAVGLDAASRNSNAEFIVAVGTDVLYNVWNSKYSVAIGDSSLWLDSTAYKITAVGSRAGFYEGGNFATRHDSLVTFLGAESSRDSSINGDTPLYNSTALGYNSKVFASNQISFGDENVTTNLFRGNVGINTRVPDSNLTVQLGSHFKRGIKAPNLPTAAQAKVIMQGTDGTFYGVDTIGLFGGGGGSQDLASVTAIGNATPNDIQFDDGITDYTIIGTTSGNGYFKFRSSTNFNNVVLANNNLTADRTYTLPNSSGTFALGTGVSNELVYWNGTNTIGSLATATYPNLTELSYVKGLTSSAQTQLNGKLSTTLADGKFLVGNVGNVATAVTPTGDATFTNSGAFTVTAINGQSLGSLATGILKNTTATGVPSIAVAGDFPTLNQNTTGSAATLTTPRAIYGNNFDGSAALTQVIASTYGGTGNGFTKFTGPASTEKTFTLPNASATVLTDNAAVTIAQGGTGQTTASDAMNAILPSKTGNANKVLAVKADESTYELVAAGSGSGTINTGNQYRLPYYSASPSGTTLDPAAAITANRLLISDANGIPTHSSVTNTEAGYLSGVTSAIQTQLNAKAASGANTDITSVLLNQTGLVVKGASSNALTIKPNETLSAGRTLNVVTGDADRTLTFAGNATVSGTNTGDVTESDNNLTLSGQAIGTNKAVQALSDGATITWDVSGGYNGRVTLGGNRTLAITNPQQGDFYTITVVQDGTGFRTLTLPGGTVARLNGKANDSTTLSAYYRNSGYEWRSSAPEESFVALTSTYTLTSTTSTQKLFNATTNGALTVAGSTSYWFECVFSLSAMSATSGNTKFDILGAGTATITSTQWTALGLDNTTITTGAAAGGSFTASNVSSGNIVTAGTGTGLFVRISGILRINAAGTIIPSVGLTTAAAAVVGVNSYFKLTPIGSNTITNVGNWN